MSKIGTEVYFINTYMCVKFHPPIQFFLISRIFKLIVLQLDSRKSNLRFRNRKILAPKLFKINISPVDGYHFIIKVFNIGIIFYLEVEKMFYSIPLQLNMKFRRLSPPLPVKMEKYRTNSFTNTFVPMTSRLG